MAESTLAIDIEELKSRIGHRLRYGRDHSDWSEVQKTNVDSVLRTAMRMACYPPPVNVVGTQGMVQHRWSWLMPTTAYSVWETRSPQSGYTVVSNGGTPAVITSGGSTAFKNPSMIGKTISFYTNDSNMTLVGSGTVTTMSGTGTLTLADGETIAAATYRWGMTADGNYRLPDDFAGFDGAALLFAPNIADWSVELSSEFSIIAFRQQTSSTYTGKPKSAAVRAVSGTGSDTPQRWELMIYPTPDDDYTLYGRQVRAVDAMSQVLRYPPGGMPYARLFETACMAACEAEMDDAKGGPDYQEFLSVLSQCVTHDLQSTVPRMAGVIRSNKTGYNCGNEHVYRNIVTYGGMSLPS